MHVCMSVCVCISMLYLCFIYAASMLYLCYFHSISMLYLCYIYPISKLCLSYIYAISALYLCHNPLLEPRALCRSAPFPPMLLQQVWYLSASHSPQPCFVHSVHRRAHPHLHQANQIIVAAAVIQHGSIRPLSCLRCVKRWVYIYMCIYPLLRGTISLAMGKWSHPGLSRGPYGY